MLARPLETAVRVAPWVLAGSFLCWYFDLLTPAASSADWLDQSALWVLSLLKAAGGWMLATLVMPIAAFLAKHWLIIGALVLGIVFFSHLSEWHTVAIHTVRETAHKFEVKRRKRSTQRAKDREEAVFLAMSEDDFARLMEKKRAERRWHERRSEILNAEAFRSFGRFGFKADALRKRARTHSAAANALTAEMRRLESVWNFVGQKRALHRVFGLMQQLLSRDDAEARHALKELNLVWRTFDWNVFIPHDMPDADRARLLRFLQMMASTAHLGEARSAYEQVRRMRDRYYDRNQEAA